jgi:hypothetical protein
MSDTYPTRLASLHDQQTLKQQAQAAGLRDFQIEDVLQAYELYGWATAQITLSYLQQTTQLRCQHYKSPRL